MPRVDFLVLNSFLILDLVFKLKINFIDFFLPIYNELKSNTQSVFFIFKTNYHGTFYAFFHVYFLNTVQSVEGCQSMLTSYNPVRACNALLVCYELELKRIAHDFFQDMI